VQADRVADGIPLCRDPHGPANRVPGLRAPSLYRAAAECPEVPLIVSGPEMTLPLISTPAAFPTRSAGPVIEFPAHGAPSLRRRR